jgi:hypothetical protein
MMKTRRQNKAVNIILKLIKINRVSKILYFEALFYLLDNSQVLFLAVILA